MIDINLLKQIPGRKGGPRRRGAGFARPVIIAVIGIAIVVAGIEIMHVWVATPYKLPAISWRKADSEVGPTDTMPGQLAGAQKRMKDTVAVKTDTGRRDTFPSGAAAAKPDTSKNKPVLPALAANKPANAGAGANPPNKPANAGGANAGVSKADTTKNKPVSSAIAANKPANAGEDIAFADNVFAAIVPIIPDSMEFTAITLDSFAKVSIAGLSESRECIGRFFSDLPSANFDLAPPPHSFIRPAGGGGYGFRIESRAAFHEPGENALARPALRESLAPVVAEFDDLLKTSGITVRKGLVRTGADAGDDYRRYHYSLSGFATLSDFVCFLRNARNARLPCAFRTLRLTPAADGKVSIDASVDVIARE